MVSGKYKIPIIVNNYFILDDTIIEHFTSFEKAVECSAPDDNMIIYPGCYNVGGLVFKHKLSLAGNGTVLGGCVLACSEPI